MPYHLDLTLQQRATLSIAISIWNKRDVKDKIRTLFYVLPRLKFHDIDGEWKQLTHETAEKVNQYVLPPQLKDELMHVIKELGGKIYNWCQYIQNEHQAVYGEKNGAVDYISEIYWTPIGTVDEAKTIQAHVWVPWSPELAVMYNIVGKNALEEKIQAFRRDIWDDKAAVVYNIACKNALEEDINDLWQELPCGIKKCYSKFKWYKHNYRFYKGAYNDHLIFVYWKYRRDGQMDRFAEYAVSYKNYGGQSRIKYNQNYSVEHNMFLFSVFNGYNTAVKYFWKKLSQEERDTSILYSANMALGHSNNTGDMEIYIREKYAEIFIFLINQMSINQKESFLRSNRGNKQSEIFFMLSSIWPWQELILPVLYDMLPYLEDNTEPVLEALSGISKKMVNPSCVAEYGKYRSILHEVWFIIPGSIKQTMIPNHPYFFSLHNFIANLLKVEDFESIKMIFNDPEIADVRMQYIKLGKMGYKELIKSNKYGFLNQFMKEVLQSDEEKKYLKSSIHHINICEHFIKIKEYDSVDKFLNWRFATMEERKQVKDYFKNYIFSIHWLFIKLSLCGESYDEANKQTSRFLEWMLESEDEITRFKRDFIANFISLIEKKLLDNGGMCISLGKLLHHRLLQIKQILA